MQRLKDEPGGGVGVGQAGHVGDQLAEDGEAAVAGVDGPARAAGVDDRSEEAGEFGDLVGVELGGAAIPAVWLSSSRTVIVSSARAMLVR